MQYYQKYANLYLPQSIRLTRTLNLKLQERQDRYCTYNLTMGRVRATFAAADKYYIF